MNECSFRSCKPASANIYKRLLSLFIGDVKYLAAGAAVQRSWVEVEVLDS